MGIEQIAKIGGHTAMSNRLNGRGNLLNLVVTSDVLSRFRAAFQRFLPVPIALAVIALLVVAPDAPGAVTFTNLVSFNGNNGSMPSAKLVQGVNGNFYGATGSGGDFNLGTIFQFSSNGAFTNLASFNHANGMFPNWLNEGADSNFYGTTGNGGTNGVGTVFQITTNGALSSLFSFQGTNGVNPCALAQADDGSFYGATYWGGPGNSANTSGYGTLFQITTNGALTTSVWFNGTNGSNPGPTLIKGVDGNFYGTTDSGGADTNLNSANGVSVVGFGTIFELSTNGVFTTLASFNSTNGGGGVFGFLQARDGNFYGVTKYGGANQSGSVFQMSTNGLLTTLASFDGTNAAYPLCLVQATDGNFYGATHGRGNSPYANIFKMTPLWAVTILFSFNGFAYANGLMQGSDGNFYGTTLGGNGTVFRLSVPLPPIFQMMTRSSNLLTLAWSTVAGQTYQLQYNSDLNPANWTNLGPVTLATNGVVYTSDSPGPDLQRFYRAVLVQ